MTDAEAEAALLVDDTQRLLDEISGGPTKEGCFTDPFCTSLATDLPEMLTASEMQAHNVKFSNPALKRAAAQPWQSLPSAVYAPAALASNYTIGDMAKKHPFVASNELTMCVVCGLVEAEVRCMECFRDTCAFCDFQAHKCMAVAHNTMPLRAAKDSIAKREAQAKLAADSARHVQSGTSLDDTILKFFKTEEFKKIQEKVVSKQGRQRADAEQMDFLPRSNISAGGYINRCDSIGKLLGRADSLGQDSLGQGLLGRSVSTGQTLGEEFLALPDMPAMEIVAKRRRGKPTQWQEPPLKRSRVNSTCGPRAPLGERALAMAAQNVASRKPKSTPTSKVTAAAAKLKAAEAAREAAAMLMQKRPRPTDFIFKLETAEPRRSACTQVRREAYQRFKERRQRQRDNPRLRYKSRQKIADSRPRVKGRFVKTSELVTAGGIEAWKKANAGKFT